MQAFPNKEIITAPTGLKLKNRLSDEVYTSPIDGLFTTKEWADAIRVGDELVSSGLTKSAAYRYLLLLPKRITQIAKDFTTGFAAEGAQESLASLAQDLTARGLYSDTLPIGESFFLSLKIR